MKIFSLLASMFSAKKIIDNVADSSGTVSDYIIIWVVEVKHMMNLLNELKVIRMKIKTKKNNYVSNTRISTYKWFR
jgi:hypothetical protein